MRRGFFLLFTLLTGCQGFEGPFARRTERADDPRFTIAEQEKRARSKTSLPDNTYLGGPPSGFTVPGTLIDR